MTLRTPRRRISPRTKRRYRAIREFFRRAIGSPSQPDIKITSSIALNVSDLKRKIVGLEEQLDQVSKHCHDAVCLQIDSSKSDSLYPSDVHHCIETGQEPSVVSTDRKSNDIQTNDVETKVLYKTSCCNYRRSDESDYERNNSSRHVQGNGKMSDEYNDHIKVHKEKKNKLEKINEYNPKLHKHKTHSAYENFSAAYSTSSFHSLTNPRNVLSHADYSVPRNERKHYKAHYRSISPNQLKDKKNKEHTKRNNMENYYTIYEDKPVKIRKQKHTKRELDQDFIADIIRRQYKPVKMFGKRESDTSQFSVPICRDQEFTLQDNTVEGSELCSCCYDGRRTKHKRNNLSDMRSICDTHLYSSKRQLRSPHRRVVDIYNNSELYDLVPVKEKTSPKSRRKFVEDNLMPYGYHREVPPSPRTLRPRLNLKSQYCSECDDHAVRVKPRRRSPNRLRKHQDVQYMQSIESDITTELNQDRIPRRTEITPKQTKLQQEQMQDMGTTSSLQYPAYLNEQTHPMNPNKTLEPDISVDKTDKALCEIKDILQTFLQEIKKEKTSQCDKSDSLSKSGDNDTSILQHNSTKEQGSVLPNSGHSFNNYSVGQCGVPPYMASAFPNPCCYPIVCPVNCLQNGFVMPSPSYTCTNCAAAPKESACTDSSKDKTKSNDIFNSETEELIKEIYKFVAQGPIKRSDFDRRRMQKDADTKILTSRSVGESCRACKHDAKVGTPKLKYSSKSCEAIGSTVISDTNYSTNQSYSDTILERLSLEVTQSDTDISTESTTEVDRGKENKFSKVFRSMGLFKRKKKDVIEEVSESESAIDVKIKPKQRAKPNTPFRQDMTNYMMYGQEYYNQPPLSQQQYEQPTEYHPDYHPPYNTLVPNYPPHTQNQPVHDHYANKHQQQIPEHSRAAYRSPQRPTAPPYSPYDSRYNQQPQVPLCLKEIEVKSIGTQSERKMSIFNRITKKIQPTAPAYDPQRNFGTQTAVDSKPTWFKNLQMKAMQDKMDSSNGSPVTSPNKTGGGWFKNLQTKSMEDKLDPMKFSMKTQKQLAEGDVKMRNAVLKKMFKKRNPFSPRNLIVKTLLGKDRSSYGEPPMMFRPRMFF